MCNQSIEAAILVNKYLNSVMVKVEKLIEMNAKISPPTLPNPDDACKKHQPEHDVN